MMIKKKCGVTALILAALWFSCSRTSNNGTLPIIKAIDRYSATIFWTTRGPEKSTVHVYAEGEAIKTVTGNPVDSTHTVTLSGLLPDKVYYYRISGLPDREFSFRTAPLAGSPFRFCLINRDDNQSEKIERFFPDFLLFFTREITRKRVSFERVGELHSRMPFFTVGESFQWGDIQFTRADNTELSDAEKRRTIVSIYDSAAPELLAVAAHDSVRRLVIFPGGDSVMVIDSGNTTILFCAGRSMVFEAQGEELRAGVIGTADADAMPYQLKKAEISFIKTCVVCRRLLERKQYKSSIEYYRRFIVENQEQKLNDDALFQIANIYDRYLFDYQNAIDAYRRLIDQCPESGFSATAHFRLEYIQKSGDHDYEPLRVFEKARLTETATKRSEAIRSVESVLARYKEFMLRDEMLLWLGEILADSENKRAIEYLSQLQQETKNNEYYHKASMKIGDIYYARSNYGEALKHYRALAKKNSGTTAALEAKIHRSVRNQQRQIMFYCCISLIAALFLAALLVPPRGFSLPGAGASVGVVALYLLASAAPVGMYFDELVTAVPFAAAVFFSVLTMLFISSQLGRKIHGSGLSFPFAMVIHCAVTLAGTLCTLYIIVYLFHYLFIFERIFS